MPPEYLKQFLDADKSLPVPDAVLGLDDLPAGEEPSKAPSMGELLQDPDVAAVVEAANGLEPAGP